MKQTLLLHRYALHFGSNPSFIKAKFNAALIYQLIQTYTWLIFSYICCDQSFKWYLTYINAIFGWLRTFVCYISILPLYPPNHISITSISGQTPHLHTCNEYLHSCIVHTCTCILAYFHTCHTCIPAYSYSCILSYFHTCILL